jgi:hypothetical protein
LGTAGVGVTEAFIVGVKRGQRRRVKSGKGKF